MHEVFNREAEWCKGNENTLKVGGLVLVKVDDTIVLAKIFSRYGNAIHITSSKAADPHVPVPVIELPRQWCLLTEELMNAYPELFI